MLKADSVATCTGATPAARRDLFLLCRPSFAAGERLVFVSCPITTILLFLPPQTENELPPLADRKFHSVEGFGRKKNAILSSHNVFLCRRRRQRKIPSSRRRRELGERASQAQQRAFPPCRFCPSCLVLKGTWFCSANGMLMLPFSPARYA